MYDWCLSDLLHALAQLPEEVSLEVECQAESGRRLEMLSRAYGLEERLVLSTTSTDATWRFRGAATTAPDWATSGSRAIEPPQTMAEMVESLWPEDGPATVPGCGDSLLSGHRVALVTNLPTHYRVPLFNGLRAKLEAPGASMRVFFLASEASRRPWLTAGHALEFDHEFVRSFRMPERAPFYDRTFRRRPAYIPRDLSARLRTYKPTMILAGGFSVASLEAKLYASRRGIPFGIWSGDIASASTQRSCPRIRSAQRRWLARRADFGVAYGSLAERYLRALAPDLPIVIGRNTSIVAMPPARLERSDQTLEIVTVADLSVPGKGVDVLTDALKRVKELACHLTVIGGTARDAELAEAAAGDGRIRFVGPLPQEQVHAAYARSDVFPFPSRVDVFGLSLVEAMATGLALVVSPLPGAVADLAVPGHNCLVADPDDPASWAAAITRLADAPEVRMAAGKAARATIERRWTIPHAVEAMMAGFRLGALTAERSKS